MTPSVLLDAALDRSVVLGYTRVGPALRRRWWPADPPPGALAGRRVLVTGATSGIGEAAAAGFAALGATVHMLGRDPQRTAAAAEGVRRRYPDAEVVEEVCDVGDLGAVRDWCGDFAARVPALHGLVHNAGTMVHERTETADGHELSLAVHVLGPHLMTELLLPALRGAGGATVVWMSSGGMYGARLRDDDLEFRRGDYSGVAAYARTKRMQVVLAQAWAERLSDDLSDIRVESMHPGWVETKGVAEHLPTFRRVTGRALRDADSGADTAVWLVATRPAPGGQGPGRGHFWHDRRPRPTTRGWQPEPDPARISRFLDQVTAATRTSSDWSGAGY
jgi:dehydrogenase/reductase SDR family protein 12